MRSTLLFCLAATAWGASAGQPLDVPFFAQQKNGCGAASVAMVMRYWKDSTDVPSPDQVYQRLYDAHRRGILLSDMKSYLTEEGFQAFTLRGGIPDIGTQLEKGRPIIVGLKKSPAAAIHFAVVVGAAQDRVWINDPTRSKTTSVKLSRFAREWGQADHWMLLATPR